MVYSEYGSSSTTVICAESICASSTMYLPSPVCVSKSYVGLFARRLMRNRLPVKSSVLRTLGCAGSAFFPSDATAHKVGGHPGCEGLEPRSA